MRVAKVHFFYFSSTFLCVDFSLPLVLYYVRTTLPRLTHRVGSMVLASWALMLMTDIVTIWKPRALSLVRVLHYLQSVSKRAVTYKSICKFS